MFRLVVCALWLLAGASAVGAEVKPHKTGLPLPRFVSIKSEQANARRGPDQSHRIDWVYQRAGLPVEIIDEHDHWRKVRDFEGQGGWIHYALLSGRRTALLTEDAELHTRAAPDANVVARLSAGVVARIRECGTLWCRVSKDGYTGWLPKSAIWGVREGEIIE